MEDRPLIVEWLLVDAPDSLNNEGQRATLVHVPHIASVRCAARRVLIFLRGTPHILILQGADVVTLWNQLLTGGVWTRAAGSTLTAEWFGWGLQVFNVSEVTSIEFDVSLTSPAQPTGARITSTFPGDNATALSSDGALHWWRFAQERGITLETLRAAYGLPQDSPDAPGAAPDQGEWQALRDTPGQPT